MKSSFLTKTLLLLSVTAILGVSAIENGENVNVSEGLDTPVGNITDFPRDTNTLDVDLHPELSGNLIFQICYKITMAFVAVLRLYLRVLNDVVDRMDAIPSCTNSFRTMFRRLFTRLNCKSEQFAFSNSGKFWDVVFVGQTNEYECVGDNQWDEIEKGLTVAFNENDQFDNVSSFCLNLKFDEEWSALVRLQVSSEKTYTDLYDIPCDGDLLSYIYKEDEGEWTNSVAKIL
ncbi:hypothetical protein, no similarity [Maudiozyma saulgeensis]|uniref:Uncharacterized protein n=1 Tax=Maudiozyma saulgeensis TaxID=1789683 RepID=A0A1X7R434_9SACH|nr:hypothetical protein, no similarity [Kazachstania saulgeensis]